MVSFNPEIYTTRDKGNLLIGFDEFCAGKVTDYENCFTILFAKIFHLSTAVRINGKKRHLNTEKYISWLAANTAHNNVTKETLKDFCDFSKLEFKKLPRTSIMRENLSPAKREKLAKKLETALIDPKRQNFHKAERLVAKGANLTRGFWLRERFGVTHGRVSDYLPSRPLQFTATYYTPLLFAAERNQDSLCNMMKRCKVDTSARGETVRFKRSIADSSWRDQLQVNLAVVPNRVQSVTWVTLSSPT